MANGSNQSTGGVWRRLRATLGGVARGLRHSALTRQVRGKLRRWWLVTFRPGYVRRQLARREGECGQCGVCCGLGNTCPVLHFKKHCLIYHGYRPRACRFFPIDERDLRDVELAGGHCQYRFRPPDSAAG
ncbi:MAG: hypothetical protein WC789_09715 [Lentisphaeria bacterium]